MIRGTKRPLEKKLDLRASIHNRFDVEVIDAATGEVKQKVRAFNVICNTWWSRLFRINNGWSPTNRAEYIAFGTGSGTPSAADTALFSYLGNKLIPNKNFTYDFPSGLAYMQGIITLQAEEYVGSTLTEVGLSYSAGNITTHAMLEDMNGNPISIEKTATDIIKIYATVYLHFSSGGWYNGSVMLTQDSRNYYALVRCLLGNSGDGLVFYPEGAGRRTMALTQLSADRPTCVPTLDLANKTMSFTLRLSAAQLNLPIRALQLCCSGTNSTSMNNRMPAFTLVPGSWYTPQQITAEAVGTGNGVETGFSTAFPVGTVGTVYVDGVPASGVTMRRGPADLTSLQRWMNPVYKTDSGIPGLMRIPSGYNETSQGAVQQAMTIELASGAKTAILENSFAYVSIEKFRLASTSSGPFTIWASDDMENWTSAGSFLAGSSSSPADCAIPAALQSKRYWQLEDTGSAGWLYLGVVGIAADQTHNIVFASPPAAGAVITCDYVPDCIAKDENHVFDISMVLTLSEYQEV